MSLWLRQLATLVLAVGLARPAAAVTCDDITNMARVGLPVAFLSLVLLKEPAPDKLTACLASSGAPPSYQSAFTEERLASLDQARTATRESGAGTGSVAAAEPDWTRAAVQAVEADLVGHLRRIHDNQLVREDGVETDDGLVYYLQNGEAAGPPPHWTRADAITYLEWVRDSAGVHERLRPELQLDLRMFLAYLYYEHARDLHLGSVAEFEKANDRCSNTPGCDTGELEPDNQASRLWLRKALAAYEGAMVDFALSDREEEARFFTAWVNHELGEHDTEIEQLESFTEKFSASHRLPVAYVLLGEYFFDKKDYTKALLSYNKAVRFEDSSWHGVAN
jgi:hypothetical protein